MNAHARKSDIDPPIPAFLRKGSQNGELLRELSAQRRKAEATAEVEEPTPAPTKPAEPLEAAETVEAEAAEAETTTAATEPPQAPTTPSTGKAARWIASARSDRDQTLTRIEGLQAEKLAADEEAHEAIRQIEAARDAKFASVDAKVAEENVILAGIEGGLEAATQQQRTK